MYCDASLGFRRTRLPFHSVQLRLTLLPSMGGGTPLPSMGGGTPLPSMGGGTPAEPPLVISDFINTRRTHTNILTLTETFTLGKQIEVDIVSKSRATVETTAPRGLGTGTRNGRKERQATARMGILNPRDLMSECRVDDFRDETIST